MYYYSKICETLVKLILLEFTCVTVIIGCTKKEIDIAPSERIGFLYTWVKSYHYNSETGLIDTIRPLLREDSIFILKTGYITVYKGSIVQFRSEVLDNHDFENYNTGTCYHDYFWSALRLENGTSMIYTTAVNEPFFDVRFGNIENEHYMEFDCNRIDLYKWEILN